jgi:hypothetical protein
MEHLVACPKGNPFFLDIGISHMERFIGYGSPTHLGFGRSDEAP